jgi:hypothetical protein
MKVVESLLSLSGIGKDRLRLRWVSASEGQLFAQYVREYHETIEKLGPLYAENFQMPMKAVKRALDSQRLRWLMGMQPKLTDTGNVYGEKVDAGVYDRLLHQVSEEEYQKALILETLEGGPASTREIALSTGLGVYDVARRINELERSHQAAFAGFDNRTARFALAS